MVRALQSDNPRSRRKSVGQCANSFETSTYSLKFQAQRVMRTACSQHVYTNVSNGGEHTGCACGARRCYAKRYIFRPKLSQPYELGPAHTKRVLPPLICAKTVKIARRGREGGRSAVVEQSQSSRRAVVEQSRSSRRAVAEQSRVGFLSSLLHFPPSCATKNR